jgi:predicted nicotinamide N-methyase
MGGFGTDVMSATERLADPAFPELPPIPGGWSTQVFEFSDRRFDLVLPRVPDDFLDDAEVSSRHVEDGYMPYWSYLWPTSLEVGEQLLARGFPRGLQCLEIGSGIGLTGIVALSAGFDVVFSDYDEVSLQLAGFNARRNGFDCFRTLRLDWRDVPTDTRYPFILGCEVIYERGNHPLILALCEKLLSPGGEVWIGDPGRHSADLFFADARAAGWTCECTAIPRKPYSDRPPGVTNVWRMRRTQELDLPSALS